MRQNILYICLSLGFLALTLPAVHARERVDITLSGNSSSTAEPNCEMVETAQVSINLNSTETDVTKIQPLMDTKTKEVEALAKEAGVDKLEVQSSNFNIYTNSGGGCGTTGSNSYQFNGSVSFNVTPAGKAPDLMVLLTQKGFNTNVNVNAYKQCQ